MLNFRPSLLTLKYSVMSSRITTFRAIMAFSLLSLLPYKAIFAQDFRSENLYYIGGGREAIADFAQHADQISIICPASYQIDSDGVISGDVDPRITEIAQAHGIKVMPLFACFDQKGIHMLLQDPAARLEAIRLLLFYAMQQHFYGWQFDLENVSFKDKDAYTSFYAQAADSLHAHGLKISMAIVKTDQLAPQRGNVAYQRFLYRDWDGAFDVKRIADVSDFISYMTYDQNTALTPPGPVAGLPWMKDMLQYLLDSGVPPSKISLGIPGYSDYWFPTWDSKDGAHSTRAEIGYADAMDLVARYKLHVNWMADQAVHFAYWDNFGVFNWLFLEDAASWKPKLQLAKDHHVLGISVWILGTEDPHTWDVLKDMAHTVKIK